MRSGYGPVLDGRRWLLLGLYICIDHYDLGPFATVSKSGTRFEALDPVLKAVRDRSGRVEKGVCQGDALKHDHGSHYVSRYFENQLRWLGMKSSPAYVGEPEGNGVTEWFIKTLKEQVIWPDRFRSVAKARKATDRFIEKFKKPWLVARLGYRTPLEVLRKPSRERQVAD